MRLASRLSCWRSLSSLRKPWQLQRPPESSCPSMANQRAAQGFPASSQRWWLLNGQKMPGARDQDEEGAAATPGERATGPLPNKEAMTKRGGGGGATATRAITTTKTTKATAAATTTVIITKTTTAREEAIGAGPEAETGALGEEAAPPPAPPKEKIVDDDEKAVNVIALKLDPQASPERADAAVRTVGPLG
mmetsp:Transcript_49202/g.104707  ORF Transcript_49202/g.104707 Transcript_49202/m.104707 type:complete len:192 (-) Transcript_49202:171-746(-)